MRSLEAAARWRSGWLWGLMATCCGASSLLLGWGFSVDDAWIVRRVVLHGLAGEGFAFNRGTPTDAITPLGFAQLVGAVSWLTSWDPLLAARLLGLLGTSVGLGLMGSWALSDATARVSLGTRIGLFALICLSCLPLSAWAGAGLATGLVTGWVSAGFVALVPSRPFRKTRPDLAALLLGAAAALRPELLPSAGCLLVLGLRRTFAGPQSTRLLLRGGLFFAAPVLASVTVRWVHFGHPLPLAAIAKAPSLEHGLRYALGGALLVGPLWLCFSSVFVKSLRKERWMAVPMLVHLGALVLAGGDWMPLFRLWVPWIPVAVALGVRFFLESSWARVSLVPTLLAGMALWWSFGADARQVVARREELIERARPLLKNARVVAAVDVGWLGAATDATIVDLAGVTDPRIAQLVGGHTSKRISPGLFSDREVDTWVVRTVDLQYRPGDPLVRIHPVYVVDARLLLKAEDLAFVPTDIVLLPGTGGGYVILRHRRLASADS